MTISGPDNTTPKLPESSTLPKSEEPKKKMGISINSIIEDLRVTTEEGKLLHLNREYDLTKEEDIEAFQKDMKFDEFGINVHEMINNIKEQRKNMQQASEHSEFGIDFLAVESQQNDNPDVKGAKKPRISYGQALRLLNEHPMQMEMNMQRDGGSTSVTIHTPEGTMTISINRELGDKYNGCITVIYPDGEIQMISPNGFLVNPKKESEQKESEQNESLYEILELPNPNNILDRIKSEE